MRVHFLFVESYSRGGSKLDYDTILDDEHLRVGNAMIDGTAAGPEYERNRIEVKTPANDVFRGVSQ